MSLILALAAASAAASPAAPPPKASPEEERFTACVAQIDGDPQAALDTAGQWRLAGGGVLARQCQGMAYAAQARWASAMAAFQQAAEASETTKDGRTANLWVQAANAALAAGDHVKARSYLDAALILGTLKNEDAGEAHLDRARALVATNDPTGARADLDMALKLVPGDPLAWLLSATLARRMGDLERAHKDIGEAVKRAPDDASVALEAGNISALLGYDAAAKTAWEAAARIAPESPQGKAAAKALEQFETPPASPAPEAKTPQPQQH